MSRSANSNMALPPAVALVAWLVPGAGYYLIGQRIRALVIGLTILGLFILGVLIGGLRVVDPSNLDYIATPFRALLDRPWFIGQFLTGPISLLAVKIAQATGAPAAHARVHEIGTLYTAVAGMLNLLAIIDSAYRSGSAEEKA